MPQTKIRGSFVPLLKQQGVLSMSNKTAPNALKLPNKPYQASLGAVGYQSFIKPLQPIRLRMGKAVYHCGGSINTPGPG